MAKYFVSLGGENRKGNKRAKRLEKELETLANNATGEDFAHYSYVTEDLKEAKRVAKEAVDVYKKYGFEDLASSVYVTTLLECPKCGYQARFGGSYCSQCGNELTRPQKIDIQR
jgi:hypothetical protein